MAQSPKSSALASASSGAIASSFSLRAARPLLTTSVIVSTVTVSKRARFAGRTSNANGTAAARALWILMVCKCSSTACMATDFMSSSSQPPVASICREPPATAAARSCSSRICCQSLVAAWPARSTCWCSLSASPAAFAASVLSAAFAATSAVAALTAASASKRSFSQVSNSCCAAFCAAPASAPSFADWVLASSKALATRSTKPACIL
mmetsp:Transcript_79640/g.200343  ORF Transcript_79640/g.200343 Transcript_79640/m.200343 type:complete len:209 (+) Transcript_79640:352-978(+)